MVATETHVICDRCKVKTERFNMDGLRVFHSGVFMARDYTDLCGDCGKELIEFFANRPTLNSEVRAENA